MTTTRVSLIFDMTLPSHDVQVTQFQFGMIRRTKLLKVFLVLLCLVIVLALVSINKQPLEKTVIHPRQRLKEKVTEPPKEKRFIIFHLDLKGAPPKMEYLLEVLPLAKQAGANGVLLEYEDTFPWSGMLSNVSAGNAYTLEEVKTLLNLASNLDMEVIPLVQTFGHLEFVLKLNQFRHLRELDSFPQEVCPSKEESLLLIQEMIRQVMEVHQGARYLHIGCDEVYHLGACSLCSRRNPRSVFSAHVRKISEHVRKKYPGVKIIIWDDMLRRWSPIDIMDSGLGGMVEPMVWVYIDDIPRLVPHFIWFVYKKTFQKVWGASAYKGAFGEKEILPDIPRHVDNNLAWLRLMEPIVTENTVMHKEDFHGIVLTGWSRYDHFAVLSELLPLAIPSLILSLALIDAYTSGLTDRKAEEVAFARMMILLKCPEPFPFHNLEEMRLEKFQWMFGSCSYPGSELYKLMHDYFALQARYTLVMNQKDSSGWVSEYNIKHNYSSPYRVIELFQEEGFAGQKLLKDIAQFKKDVSESLGHFYDVHTIREWLEQKVEPMELKLRDTANAFQHLIEIKTWPRRPLVPAET